MKFAPLLITLLLTPLATLHSADVPAQKPNILLIVADDLGYGDVSAYGCTDFATPHLDSIAKAGRRFTSGYVTAPVCGPSRAALLTGRHNCRILPFEGNPSHGSDVGLPLEHKTMADHLKGAGYRTAALGKWHLGETPQHHPMSRGFDEFFGFLSGMHSYFKAEDAAWGPLLRGREKTELKDYLTFALADEACAIIRRSSPEPFFLYLAFNAPHVPLEAPETYLAKTAHLADPRRRLNAAMILAMDDAVGRVLAALRESGRADNTLIVFLSDNGAALIKGSAENGGSNAPLRGSKAQLWEGGIRVPFFVQWPGRIAGGGVSDTPVSSLDLLPTLLAAAGVPAQPEWKLDGLNLLPWLEGRGEQLSREQLFWKFGATQFAIRDGDIKLVRVNADKGLFNVRTDVGEKTDCTGEHPVLSRRLESAWKSWDAKTLAPKRPPLARQPRTTDPVVRIEQDAGVWWFRSPAGKRLLSVGMNHVEPVYWTSPNNQQFVLETFGRDLFLPGGQFNEGSEAARKWASRAAANLKTWGFNTLGMHNPPLESLRSAVDGYYAPADQQRETLAAIYQATQKPIVIGDTACRPVWKDHELTDTGYYTELGQVYSDDVRKLFSLPYLIGWHHCGYMRGLRPPYVAALKRGDQPTIAHHVQTKITLREGFITELEVPIEPILKPLSLAISECETLHRASASPRP